MSNNSQQGDTSNQPLFQGLDEKERLYAPEQVPNTGMPASEIDQGGTAAAGGGITNPGTTSDPDREAVVGSEGQYAPPIIPAQSTIGTTANTPVPPTAAPDLLTNRDADDADRRR